MSRLTTPCVANDKTVSNPGYRALLSIPFCNDRGRVGIQRAQVDQVGWIGFQPADHSVGTGLHSQRHRTYFTSAVGTKLIRCLYTGFLTSHPKQVRKSSFCPIQETINFTLSCPTWHRRQNPIRFSDPCQVGAMYCGSVFFMSVFPGKQQPLQGLSQGDVICITAVHSSKGISPLGIWIIVPACQKNTTRCLGCISKNHFQSLGYVCNQICFAQAFQSQPLLTKTESNQTIHIWGKSLVIEKVTESPSNGRVITEILCVCRPERLIKHHEEFVDLSHTHSPYGPAFLVRKWRIEANSARLEHAQRGGANHIVGSIGGTTSNHTHLVCAVIDHTDRCVQANVQPLCQKFGNNVVPTRKQHIFSWKFFIITEVFGRKSLQPSSLVKLQVGIELVQMVRIYQRRRIRGIQCRSQTHVVLLVRNVGSGICNQFVVLCLGRAKLSGSDICTFGIHHFDTAVIGFISNRPNLIRQTTDWIAGVRAMNPASTQIHGYAIDRALGVHPTSHYTFCFQDRHHQPCICQLARCCQPGHSRPNHYHFFPCSSRSLCLSRPASQQRHSRNGSPLLQKITPSKTCEIRRFRCGCSHVRQNSDGLKMRQTNNY